MKYEEILKTLEVSEEMSYWSDNSDQIKEAIEQLKSLATKSYHKQSLKTLGEINLFGLYGQEADLHSAYLYFKKLADKTGDSYSHSMIGFLAFEGLGTPLDIASSHLYHSFAAIEDNTFSLMVMGYRILNGIASPKSCKNAALHYFQVASKVAEKKKNHKLKSFVKKRLDEVQNESASSSQEDIVQYYMYLADRGDNQAQFLVGQVYYYGGVDTNQDFPTALRYLRQAASGGNANAMGLLGQMYWRGEGVDADAQTALHYFRAGATHNSPVALNGMGLMYSNGIGVAKDVDEAMKYFIKAAEKDLPDAQYNIAMMLKEVAPTVGMAKMINYLQMAARKGHLLALFELGKMNMIGMEHSNTCSVAVAYFKSVAEQDDEMGKLIDDAFNDYHGGRVQAALIKYLFAAQMGDEVAQYNAAILLDQQRDEDSYARAIFLFNRAAIQGNSVARVKLGDYFFYGHAVPIDYYKAVLYYQAADQDRNAQAMFNLAWMYENGVGVSKDYYLAKRYYDKCLMHNKDAVIAVSLALLKLNVGFYLTYLVDFVTAFMDLSVISSIVFGITTIVAYVMFRDRIFVNHQ